MQLTEPQTRTLREWDDMRIDGQAIMDPDGFDRKDPQMWERRYTREEFLERRARCTVHFLMTEPQTPTGKRQHDDAW